MPRFTDELDQAIVRLLEENGRMSNLGIARRLGVSESVVRKRISRLIETKGMRIVASLDGSPRMTEMIFLLHTEAGHRIGVAERLAALPDVRHVALTTGSCDIVVRAAFHSDAQALDFLVQHLEGAPGIQSTQASHVLKNLVPSGTVTGISSGSGLRREQALAATLGSFVAGAAQAGSLGEVLDLGCDAAISGFGADRVAIYLVEPNGQLTYQRSRGLSAEYLAGVKERLRSNPGVGPRVSTGHSHLYVEDASTSPLLEGLEDLVKREGYRSLLFLPMLYGQEVAGIIGLYNDHTRRYSDAEIALAQAFADQLAVAMRHCQGDEPASRATKPEPQADLWLAG